MKQGHIIWGFMVSKLRSTIKYHWYPAFTFFHFSVTNISDRSNLMGLGFILLPGSLGLVYHREKAKGTEEEFDGSGSKARK